MREKHGISFALFDACFEDSNESHHSRHIKIAESELKKTYRISQLQKAMSFKIFCGTATLYHLFNRGGIWGDGDSSTEGKRARRIRLTKLVKRDIIRGWWCVAGWWCWIHTADQGLKISSSERQTRYWIRSSHAEREDMTAFPMFDERDVLQFVTSSWKIRHLSPYSSFDSLYAS